MTDRLSVSPHKTLRVYGYLYRDQATLPKNWKFKRELRHVKMGLKK